MTDLEFIEIEMECCEIDFVLAQKREDKIMTRHLKERYEQLKQIKAKLEAWEVVKPYVDIIDKYTPYPTWQLKPNYDECKLKETNILIKALEAKNECRN